MALRHAWAWLLLVAALGGACASSEEPAAKPKRPVVTGCSDRPENLPRPPEGRLPCDLMPPGWAVESR